MGQTLRISAIVASLLFSASAQAAFYVNEDAAPPLAPVIAASNMAMSLKKDATLYVSFFGTKLSRSGRAALEERDGIFRQADSISVNAFARSRSRLSQANRRASAVKEWLVKQGIADSKIEIYTEVDPEIDPDDTDVQVVARANKATAARDAYRPAQFLSPSVPPSPALQPVTRQDGFTDQARIEFARRIMSMAQRKIISAEDAVRLVTELLQSAAPSAMQNPAQPQKQVLIAQTPIAEPVIEPQAVWTLKGNSSLRENMDAWARAAGYAPPLWTTSNAYEVRYDKSFNGTFLEALAQVADAVPSLDFRVSQGRRTLQVQDAKRPN
ncbi:hypothetical protein FX016_23090 [Cupriavidus gilardii]|nr:hypothetical protein FX016_23090 [Cupriavidus gilardii]